jgi:hypothetical protein
MYHRPLGLLVHKGVFLGSRNIGFDVNALVLGAGAKNNGGRR